MRHICDALINTSNEEYSIYEWLHEHKMGILILHRNGLFNTSMWVTPRNNYIPHSFCDVHLYIKKNYKLNWIRIIVMTSSTHSVFTQVRVNRDTRSFIHPFVTFRTITNTHVTFLTKEMFLWYYIMIAYYHFEHMYTLHIYDKLFSTKRSLDVKRS